MKLTRKMISTAISMAILASATMSATVQAEGKVAASAGVASAYLWRGQDLGNGDPAVFGDLTYSNSGFYTGIWGSSGDAASGNEYDLFAGYGKEFGDFSVDLSVWTYVYPDGENTGNDTMGNLSEVVLGLAYGAFSLKYYDNVAGGSGYSYITLGADINKFSVLLGTTQNKDSRKDYTHLDLAYAYNDNLTFKISKVVNQEVDNTVDDDMNFVVSYSLPIK